MANPYTSGEDMNPFAEELGNAPAPQRPRSPQQGGTSARTSPQRASTPQQFYNPSSSAEAQGPAYTPTDSTPPPHHGGDAGFTAQPANNQPHTAVNVQQQAQQQGQAQQPEGPKPARELQTLKVWKMGFYQQFFDVNTADVLRRLANTLVPFSPPDFLRNREWHSSPGGPVGQRLSDFAARVAHAEDEKMADLYGPFWICTTLWITIGVVGNFVSKMEHVRSGSTESWNYDFKEASVACVVVYAYTLLMSLLVWGIMKWKAVPAGFQDVLALYGYSMFVPWIAAILCGIPNAYFQWAVCLLSGVWSCMYLLANFWRLWRTTLAGPWFTGIVAAVVCFQVGLTISLKFFFFNY